MLRRRLWLSSFLILAFGLALALPTVAALNLGLDDVGDAAEKAGYDAKTDDTTLAKTIGTVIKAVLSLVGILFTVLMVYAGEMWMTARGDTDHVEKAKKLINQAVIGLIVTLAAYAISNLAVNAILDRALGDSSEAPSEAPK